FFQRLKILGKDSRFLEGVRIAAIGEATRELLLENGIEPDLVPKKFTSEELVLELTRKKEIEGRHFLLPRTDIAPPYLKEELEKHGAKITQVISYRTVPACGEREKKTLRRWLEGGEIDFVTFTSASTVDHFFALLPKQKRGKMKSCPRLISIGPVTSRALCRYGARPWREAKEHTMKGILDVISKESR
ncbi:MAG TPA: uroporphyrinogen-III synthase, partial [bacterium]|nr:uroporphyrinogen-III synthase [bacterium]